jgi:hypothetical protein
MAITFVVAEAELLIGLDRVEPAILQSISAQLVGWPMPRPSCLR